MLPEQSLQLVARGSVTDILPANDVDVSGSNGQIAYAKVLRLFQDYALIPEPASSAV